MKMWEGKKVKPKYNVQSENNILTVKDRIKQKTQEEGGTANWEIWNDEKKIFFSRTTQKRFTERLENNPLKLKLVSAIF